MAARSAILSVRILGDAKGAVKGLNETSTAAGRMGSLVAAGAAAAGAALVGLAAGGIKAVSMAGDLEQSTGAIGAVFKDSAGQMNTWSAQAQTSVGLTKNEFNELGTLIGSQLKNGGTAMDELAPKTNELITLGADLSSMFGGDTKTAVEALSSALKGERDPIEAYGVSLNQAKIDAEAASLGFSKVGGSLSDEATQAATLSLIMKQTADAHGNFAKESGTLQGQMQRANATWQNIVTTLGTRLLPVATEVFTVINERILPAVQSFAEGLGEGGLAGALGPLSGVFADVRGGFAAMIQAFQDGSDHVTTLGISGVLEGIGVVARNVFDEVSGGLTAMVAAFRDGEDQVTSSGLAGVLEGIGVVARNVFDAIAPAIAQLGPILAPLIPQVLELASSFSPVSLIFQALTPLLPQIAALVGQVATTFAQLLAAVVPLAVSLAGAIVPVLTQIAAAILPVLGQVLGVVASLLPQLVPLFTMLATAVVGVVSAVLPLVAQLVGALAPILGQLAATVLPVVVAALEAVVPAVVMVVNILLATLMPVIQALLPVVTSVFGAVSTIITGVMQVVSGIIQVVLGVITGNWSSAWSGLQSILSGVWNIIKGVITAAVNIVRGVIATALGIITGLWNGAWTGISTFFGNIWSGLVSGLSGWIGNLLGIVRGIPDSIRGIFSGAGQWLVSAGRSIIDGLINGAGQLLPKIGRFFLDMVPGWIRGPFEKALGIHSPSRVFAGYGGDTMEGYNVGVLAKQRDTMRSITTLADTVKATGRAKLSGALDVDPGGPRLRVGAPTLSPGTRSTAAPVEINVTIQAGVGDPVAIGRELDRVLTRYRRTLGGVVRA